MGQKADAIAAETQRFKDSVIAEVRAIDRGERDASWSGGTRDTLLRNLGLYEMYYGDPAPSGAAVTETASRIPAIGERTSELGPEWYTMGSGITRCCRQSTRDYVCTRPVGHADGLHVAAVPYGSVVEVWRDGDSADRGTYRYR